MAPGPSWDKHWQLEDDETEDPDKDTRNDGVEWREEAVVQFVLTDVDVTVEAHEPDTEKGGPTWYDTHNDHSVT